MMVYDGSTWDFLRGDATNGALVNLGANNDVTITSGTVSMSGHSVFKSIDLDESEEEVKDTAGIVTGAYVCNLDTATNYLKWYNVDADDVIVGTTTPTLTMPVPAGQCANIDVPVGGLTFNTAITVAVTAALADSDATDPGTSIFTVAIYYQ